MPSEFIPTIPLLLGGKSFLLGRPAPWKSEGLCVSQESFSIRKGFSLVLREEKSQVCLFLGQGRQGARFIPGTQTQ